MVDTMRAFLTLVVLLTPRPVFLTDAYSQPTWSRASTSAGAFTSSSVGPSDGRAVGVGRSGDGGALRMGLFSSSAPCGRGEDDGRRRSYSLYSLKRFAANNVNVRRLLALPTTTETTKPTTSTRLTATPTKIPSGRRSILSLVTKSRTRLRSIRFFCRNKYKRCTLSLATALFATTLFTSSLTDPLLSPKQQPMQPQRSQIVSVANGGARNTDAAVRRHLTSHRGGGRGISAARPSLQIRRTARPHPLQTTPTPNAKAPLANIPLLQRPPKSSAPDPTAIAHETKKTFKDAISDLQTYMKGAKSDTLLLLLATSLITPLCKQLGTSPILGFLAAGMALGPNALGLISGIHTTETLAELGIVFFLFEMGLELSIDRLLSMRKDVFGLGLSQFAVTAAVLAAVGSLFGVPANALVVLGGGLALSSSAFVLQLLKDNDQLATRFGKAAFGVLLFQDLAVVPLLVVTPILAGGGTGMAQAVGSALIKAAMALGSIAFAGRVVLNPLFKTVAGSNSQEAFLGVILLTVLSMSFMTEGLGLSNTLGAFLAGVLLSETKYRYQVEADIAPFRGILLGLFFVTVGFEIDFGLISSKLPIVASIVAGIIFIKTMVTTLLSLAFGLSLSTSQQTGLILSQGGEFAFVAFGLARNLGILDPAMTKLMLTSVALTMAVTPVLANVGGKISKKIEENSDFTHYLGQDRDAAEIKESEGFVVVVGYGNVGKVVCDLLDRKLYRYVGLELNPNKAIEARNRGLPVFYGDIGRPEVAEAFNVGSARAVIVTIADKDQANRAVISLRRAFPETKIFARAKDADHAERLQRTLDVIAMVPVVPEDNVLLTLPFGGAVLKSLGAAKEEVDAILEQTRKDILKGRGAMGDDEEKMVLTQLGILTETMEQSSSLSSSPSKSSPSSSSSNGGGDNDEGDGEASKTKTKTKNGQDEQQPTSSEVARAAADANKKIAPMVAEVIQSAGGKADKTPLPIDVDLTQDSKDVAEKDVEPATNQD